MTTTETKPEEVFSYSKWYDMYKVANPKKGSEKGIAKAIGVSERQIRKARISGVMDHILADKLCVRLLGVLPLEVYGDEWFDNVTYDDGFDEWYEEWMRSGMPAPTRPHSDNPTVQHMIDGYLDGRTLAAIAEELGVSHTTVRNRLIEVGVKMRPRGQSRMSLSTH